MLVTNQTNQDYYFGPLHLAAGINQTLTVDDTTSTSLYLTDDSVADALNTLYSAGKISVSGAASPFPRPTGTPQVLHGDGSPEGLIYAGQGSLFMSRTAASATNYLFTKTTGIHLNTGWVAINPGGSAVYRKTTAKVVNNTTTETDLLNGEINLPAGVMGASGLVRGTCFCDFLQNAGSNYRFKLKLGATTLLDSGAFFAPPNNTVRQWMELGFEILNLGSASSQVAKLRVVMPTSSAATWTTGLEGMQSSGSDYWAVGLNTTSVDTTSANVLALTVTHSVASASVETKLYAAVVEVF